MNYSKNIFIALLSATCVLPAITAQAAEQASGKVYYRYTNEDGVRVLNHSIPPQYVHLGYEMVSINGKVLKVVDPAPSDAEAEQVARERELRQEQKKIDKLLRRRYSSALDIEAAKTRNLQELQGNISILNSNLSNVRNQIIHQQEQAASVERSGQTVGDEVLKNLAELQAEERDIQAQIKQRELEYQMASDKFDQDLKRFEEISRSTSPPSSATSNQ